MFYTKANFYSSAMKLLKLVYRPLNAFFLKTLVVNLLFSLQTLTSRKKEEVIFFSFKRKVDVFMGFFSNT